MACAPAISRSFVSSRPTRIGSGSRRSPFGSGTPPWRRTATIERMRCWFNPIRPVTPFMMMPMVRTVIRTSPSEGFQVGSAYVQRRFDLATRCTGARDESDGDRTGNGEGDQRSKPIRVIAALVAKVADEHRRRRFGDAVGREDDAHRPAEDARSEQLRSHQRNDHVLAAESEPEDQREEIDAGSRVGDEKDGNRARDE